MFVKNRASRINAYLENDDGDAIIVGVSCKILADAGTLSDSTNTPSHKGSGVWQLELTAAENSGDSMAVLFTSASRTLLREWHNQNNAALSADTATVIHTYTVTDEDTSAPVQDVRVECKLSGTDTIVGQGRTDENGQVIFNLEPGTYDFYATKSGYQFTNPDTEAVA